LSIWRKTPLDPLQIYRLNTVTYGTAGAPFVCVSYSYARPTLILFPYVDDLLIGDGSIQELRKLRLETTGSFDSAGFVLAKWVTHCTLNERQVAESEVLIGENADTKTLGLT